MNNVTWASGPKKDAKAEALAYFMKSLKNTLQNYA
jgi:hypothetical protein